MISKAQQERIRRRNADPSYQQTDRFKRGQQMSDDAALDLERKRLRKQATDKAAIKDTDPLGIGEAPNARRSGQVYPDLSDPTGAAKKAIPMPKTSARKIPDLSRSSMGANALYLLEVLSGSNTSLLRLLKKPDRSITWVKTVKRKPLFLKRI
jgi:hypothetical protein